MQETIIKVKGKFRLVSKSGKNLGEYDTEEEALEREKQVQYFKHKKMKESEKDITFKDMSIVDPTDGSWDEFDELGFIARKHSKRKKEDVEDEVDEALTAVQRIKRRAMMRKTKAARARGRRRAARRKPTMKIMKNRALKRARNIVGKRLANGKSKEELSFAERSRVEKALAKKKSVVVAVARKILPLMIKKEKEKALAKQKTNK